MKKRILYNILNEWRDEDEDDIPIDLDNMKFEPTSNMSDEPDLDDDEFVLSTSHSQYEYFPKTRDELREIIKMEIEKQGGVHVNLNMIDTSKITDMNYIFDKCYSLETLDVSEWDVSNVRNMEGMFKYCYSLRNLDVSKWDVSNVWDMNFMFWGCTILHTDITMWKIRTNLIRGMYYDARYIKHN